MSASPVTVQAFPAPREAVVTVKLNLRAEPSRLSVLRRRATPEQVLRVSRLVEGEEYLGENGWFQEDGTGLYFWSGGARMRESASPAATVATASMRVNRRADGTIRPLTNREIEQVYGPLSYAESGNGAVTITDPAWKQHLQAFKPKCLEDLGHRFLQVHTRVFPAFDRVFAAIHQKGLDERILSCGGTHVPRHKGWDPKRELSSHSWGIAIDLNVAWNGYGVEPALLGRPGCLRELVEFFAAEGFAWGGHFSGKDRDGMHFELARMDV